MKRLEVHWLNSTSKQPGIADLITDIVRWIAPLAALLLSCGCGQNPHSPIDSQSTLRRGIGGEPASLDPAAAVDSFSIQLIQDTYEGLVREGPNGDIIPAAASSWTIDSSGTTYVFELRANSHWSNGQPVRAENFVTAWQRVVDPKRAAPVANDLRSIEGAPEIIAGRADPSSLGVFALAGNRLMVKLAQPAPYFPQLLTHSSTFPVFSETAARSHRSTDWVSNGAYVLSEWRPGSRLELFKNPEYWDRDNVEIARVLYEIASDQFAQLAAYRAGQLDLTDTIPANAVVAFREQHPDEVAIAPYSAVAYYGLNMTSQPFANNLKLRKALAMAVDRRRLVEALTAGQLEAFSFVPPSIWNYHSATFEWENLPDADRLEEAKRLYREAGFSISRPLHLRLLLNSNPSINQTATLVAAMWKEELGITTSLSEEEFKVFLQSRRDKKRWDVLRLAWNADFNDASNFLEVFRSTSANNDTGYSSTSFDSMLDMADHTPNALSRRDLLERAERIMLDDLPAIPLYFFVSKHLVKPYVIGLRPNPFDRILSRSLTIVPH